MAGKDLARQGGGAVARRPERATSITFENARIMFRNFTGREGLYNAEGERNFCLVLDPKDAEELAAQGWNIKTLRPKEEGDLPLDYVQVKVGYKILPPTIKTITSRGANVITEELVDMLDYVEIGNVDLTIRPREWEPGRIKAYLKTMYVSIIEDYLELKYADVPDSAMNVLEAIPLADDYDADDDDVIDAELIDDPEYGNTPF